MGERWGIKFQVNTEALKTLSRSSRYLEKVADSINKVKESINDSVASMGSSLKKQVEALDSSVKAIQATTGKFDAMMGQQRGGGGGRHTVNTSGPGATQEWFMKKFGVTKDTYDAYKKDGRSANTRTPPGGWLLDPMGKNAAGQNVYSNRQMQVNMLKLTVTHPIVSAITDLHTALIAGLAGNRVKMDRADMSLTQRAPSLEHPTMMGTNVVDQAVKKLVAANKAAMPPPSTLTAMSPALMVQARRHAAASLDSGYGQFESGYNKNPFEAVRGLLRFNTKMDSATITGMAKHLATEKNPQDAFLRAQGLMAADKGTALAQTMKFTPASVKKNPEEYGKALVSIITDEFMVKVRGHMAASVGSLLGMKPGLNAVKDEFSKIPNSTYKYSSTWADTSKKRYNNQDENLAGVFVKPLYPNVVPDRSSKKGSMGTTNGDVPEVAEDMRGEGTRSAMHSLEGVTTLLKTLERGFGGKWTTLLTDIETKTRTVDNYLSQAEKGIQESIANRTPITQSEAAQSAMGHLRKLVPDVDMEKLDKVISSPKTGLQAFTGFRDTVAAARFVTRNPLHSEDARPDLESLSESFANEAGGDPSRMGAGKAKLSFMTAHLLAEARQKGHVGPEGLSDEDYIKGPGYQTMRHAYVNTYHEEPDEDKYKRNLGDAAKVYGQQFNSGEAFTTMEKLLAEIAANTSHGKSAAPSEMADIGPNGRINGRYIDEHAEAAFGPQKNQGKMWSDRLRNATGKMATYAVSGGLLFGGASAIASGFKEMAEFEKGLTDIKRVLNPLGSDMHNVSDEAKRMGQEYGVAATEVAKGMLVFAQQGQGMQDIFKNTEAAVMATNVTELSLVEATEALTAAQKQFLMGSNQSMTILDAWNEVENTTAVNTRVLTEALKRAGTAARVSGIDFHMFNGIAAAMGEATRKSGDTIGTAMRFILQNSRADKAVMALQELGVATEDANGNMKSTRNTLGELAGKWDHLTDAQKHNVAQSIAGTRHLNDFFVMMETWDRAVDISVTSLMSQGSAARENSIAMESLNKKLAVLKSSYDSLWATIGESGALDVLKQMVDLTTQLVKITSGASKMGGGVLGSLIGIGGTGAAIAGAAGWGLGGTLPGMMSGFGKAPALSDAQKNEMYGRDADGNAMADAGRSGMGGGFAPGAYWQQPRLQGLGMVLGGQMLKGVYDSHFRDNTPGHAPTALDTGVDMSATALTTAGMMKLVKSANGGMMNKAFLGMIALAGASQLYSQGKNYLSRSPGQMAEDKLGNLRYAEEKFATSRADLKTYIRGVGTGEVGSNDLQKIQDLKDTVAALTPGLAKFDEAGNVLVGDVQGWVKNLDSSLGDIRRQRTEAIKARMYAELGSSDVQKESEALNGALEKRSKMTDKTPLSDRLALMGEIQKHRGVLDGKILAPFHAAGLSEGQSGGAFQPFSRDELSKIGGPIHQSPEDLAITRLSDAITGRTGLGVNIRDQMKEQNISDPFMMKYVQLEKGGSLYDAKSGGVTSFTEDQVRARKEGVAKAFDTKFSEAVILTPDANLNRLVGSLNNALERLIGKNQDLIKATETMGSSLAVSLVGQNQQGSMQGGVPVQQLNMTLQAISRIDTKGVSGFNPSPIGATTNLALEMKQMIGEVDRMGKEQGINLKGLVSAGTLSADRTNTMRNKTSKWLDRLIEAGGNISKVSVSAGENDEDTQVDNRYYKGLVDNAGPETATLLDSIAQRIEALRKEIQTPDVKDQIGSLKNQAHGMLESASNIQPDLTQRHISDAIEQNLGMRQQAMVQSVNTLGSQYDFQRRTGATSGIDEFMSQPDNKSIVELLRSEVTARGEAVSKQRDDLDRYEAKPGHDESGATTMRDRLAILTTSFDAAKMVFDGLKGSVEGVTYGMKEQEKATQRLLARNQSTVDSQGYTGLKANDELIKDLWKELQELNKHIAELNKGPKTADRDRKIAELRGQGSALEGKIEQTSSDSQAQIDRRNAIMQNLPQRVLASRLSMGAGLGGENAGAAFRDVMREQLREMTEDIAQKMGPAMAGKSQPEKDAMMAQMSAAMQPLIAQFKDLDLANNPQYQKNKLLATPGDRAGAEYVESLMKQGRSANEIFSDPMMRDAAQNNPLINELIDQMGAGSGEAESLRIWNEQLQNQKMTAGATQKMADLMEKWTGQRPDYSSPLTPNPNAGQSPNKAAPAPDFSYQMVPPKMSVGSMALAGSAAVDGEGRIRQDGTPAILHQGEVVLNRKQTDAFFKNQYASGTSPSLDIGPQLSKEEVLKRLPEFIQKGIQKSGESYANRLYRGTEMNINEFKEVKLNPLMTGSEARFRQMAKTIGFNETQASQWHEMSHFVGDAAGESATRSGRFNYNAAHKKISLPNSIYQPEGGYAASLNKTYGNNEAELIENLAGTKIHEGGHALDTAWMIGRRSGLKHPGMLEANQQFTRRLWTAVLSDRSKLALESNRRVMGGYADKMAGIVEGKDGWGTSKEGQQFLAEIIRSRSRAYAQGGVDAPAYFKSINQHWFDTLKQSQKMYAGEMNVGQVTKMFGESDVKGLGILEKHGFSTDTINPTLKDLFYGTVEKRQSMFPNFEAMGSKLKGLNIPKLRMPNLKLGQRFNELAEGLQGLPGKGMESLRTLRSNSPEMIGWLIGEAIPAPMQWMGNGAEAVANGLNATGRGIRNAAKALPGLPGKFGNMLGNLHETSLFKGIQNFDATEALTGGMKGVASGFDGALESTANGIRGAGTYLNRMGRSAAGSAIEAAGEIPGKLSEGMDALHYFTQSRGIGALGSLASLGLVAAGLAGGKVAGMIGGDKWKKNWDENINPGLSGIFSADVAGNLARGKGVLGFGREAQLIGTEGMSKVGLGTKLLNNAGEGLESWGAKIGEKKLLGWAGRGLEATGTAARWGVRGLSGLGKVAGAVMEPVMIADASVDVAKGINWGIYAAGMRSKHDYQEGSNTLGSLSGAIWAPFKNTGAAIMGAKNYVTGHGYTGDWLSAQSQLDKGQDMLKEGEYAMGSGYTGAWVDNHLIARDIAADLIKAKETMGAAAQKQMDQMSLNTPLALFGVDSLQDLLKGNEAGSGGTKADFYKQQIGELESKLKDEDEAMEKYKTLTQMGNNQSPDQKDTLASMSQRRELLSKRLEMYKGLRDTKDDYQGVSNAILPGKGGSKSDFAFQIAELAKFPEGEAALRKAQGLGAFNAFVAKHPDASPEEADKWRQVGELMDLGAKLGDVIGYKVASPFNDKKELVGTDKKTDDFVVGGDNEGSANFWLAKLKGNKDARKLMDDSSPFAKAEELLQNNSKFDDMVKFLSEAGYDQYAQQHDGVKDMYEQAMQALSYKYTTGADPNELDKLSHVYADLTGKLQPKYDVTTGNYKTLMDVAGKAQELWGKLDPNVQHQKLAGGTYQPKGSEFDVWQFVGRNAPQSIEDLQKLHAQFDGWGSQAQADKEAWQKAQDAKKMADDAKATLKLKTTAPSIEYNLQHTTDGMKVVGRRKGEDTYHRENLGDLEQQIQSERKEFWAKQGHGDNTLKGLRSGVFSGDIKDQAGFNDTLKGMDSNLADAVANYNALNSKIKDTGSGTAETDAARQAAEKDRADLLSTTPYTQQTLDAVNRMAENLDRQNKAESHRKEVMAAIKAKSDYKPTQDELNTRDAQRGVIVDDSSPIIPAYYSGTSGQSNTDGVDYSGRIKKVLDATLHPGEMVLRADHADAFEQMLQRGDGYSFMSGSLPPRYDGLAMDAQQYTGGDGGSSGRVTHDGSITLNAGDDLTAMLRKIMGMLQEKDGDGKGPSYRQGDDINPRYA